MLVSAFILGLAGSIHCVGMCGPIAFMLPLGKSKGATKIFRVLLYHLGRLLSYSILGLLFGIIGKSLHLFGLQQSLSIVIGVFMILWIFFPTQKIKYFSFAKPLYVIITKIKSTLGKELNKKTSDTFLTIGFLNGFLPCGLVYLAVFGAIATGQIWQASMYMIFFGMGTIPLMTTVVYVGGFLSGSVRQQLQKAIPVIVVIIGLLFIIRGMGLGVPYLSPKPVTETVSASFECH